MAVSKKAVKRDINKNGFFINMPLKMNKVVPLEMKDKVPEGASYFEGIASNGDLNRNGYIIRESAWVSAINGYMQNPVVLLQHDNDQPIGQCIYANVDGDGLHVSAYVFDEYTNGRFSKGLFRALSTGHYTMQVEFENTVTKEVLSEADFIAKYNPDRSFWTGEVIPPEDWVLAVTKLEWVEFSVVSIGSNRKSMVTNQLAISNYFKNKYEKNNTDDEEPSEPAIKKDEKEVSKEDVREEAKKNVKVGNTCTMPDGSDGMIEDEDGTMICKPMMEKTPEKENITPDDKTAIESEKEVETPPEEVDPESPAIPVEISAEDSTTEDQPADEETASDEEPTEDKEVEAETLPQENNIILVNGMSVDEFKNAFKVVCLQVEEKNAVIDGLLEQLETLNTRLNTPIRKGLVVAKAEQLQPEKKKNALAQLFDAKGVEYVD